MHVTSNQFAFSVTETRVQRCSLYSLARVSRKSFRPGRDGDPEIRETPARHRVKQQRPPLPLPHSFDPISIHCKWKLSRLSGRIMAVEFYDWKRVPPHAFQIACDRGR